MSRQVSDKPTAKEKLFAEEYIHNGYNATMAYYKVYNCAYATANTTGHKLAKKPRVKEYVRQLQKEELEACAITGERIAQALAEIAFGNNVSNKDKISALNLLQKQFGLQQQKISADIDNKVVISVGITEE